MNLKRPSKTDLEKARDSRLPDILQPRLDVVFCGINPGLYSAAVGHHFARPGNRFWRALQAGGFTDRLLSPDEDADLLRYGCGLTNLVDRPTATADELRIEELFLGKGTLEKKIHDLAPNWLAFLGITAYRKAFSRPNAALGEQIDRSGGTRIWVLPNPSGLNAHYQPGDLAKAFTQLRRRVPLDAVPARD